MQVQILCDQNITGSSVTCLSFMFIASHLMFVRWSVVNLSWIYYELTNLSKFSENIRMSKRQMLSQIWCLAFCGQFVHLYHLFCMQSNAIFHFYCSLHLFVSSANSLICLIHRVVHLFCCHIYRMRSNLRSTLEQQHMKYRIVQNYDIIPFEI